MKRVPLTNEQVALAKAVYENSKDRKLTVKVSGIAISTLDKLRKADWSIEEYKKQAKIYAQNMNAARKTHSNQHIKEDPLGAKVSATALQLLDPHLKTLNDNLCLLIERMDEMNKRLEVIGKHTTEMADDIAGLRTDMVVNKSRSIFSR